MSLLIWVVVSLWSSLYDSVILSLRILSYSCGLTWYMLLDLSDLTQIFLDFLIRSMSSLNFAWNEFLEFKNSIFRIMPNRSLSNWYIYIYIYIYKICLGWISLYFYGNQVSSFLYIYIYIYIYITCFELESVLFIQKFSNSFSILFSF